MSKSNENTGPAAFPGSDGKESSTDILDAQTRSVLAMIERDPFLNLDMTPKEMRQAFDRFYDQIGYPALPVAQVSNFPIPGPAGPIAARAYTPQADAGRALPVMVFFHGGGMMMGSLDAYDGLCRRLAHNSGCIIVSASYRLAPENKFPAAVEDALAAVQWTHDNAETLGGDAARLVVGGESGGGYLAAAVTQILRDKGDDYIAFQLLINPAIGTRGGSASMEKYARGFFFEPEMLDWFYTQYLNDMEQLRDPRVSPILADRFEGLPPAFIIVAGVDILRNDIELYSRLLAEAGVPVKTSTYEGTIHGFTVMGGLIDAGVRAVDECAETLRDSLNP
ncbi:alpha/beta hydrolase [Kineobactrum salinum]|uniref:Alpha/beta hydrolase n=1 Tax=Kineobactrum salinum TaxID=2708301 RepID=A0A6C0TYU2_9GAMM|nr:alpha/beta hydrolase [Kineobactrum salinum]QIB64961.1 alpha/beta hydrolase [Kineobactrum salinum]